VIGVSEAEQAKRDSQATGRSRVKREKEEHAARGPVPEPCRDFRLPQSRVPALLMVWELTQVATSFLSRKSLYTWSCAYPASTRSALHIVLSSPDSTSDTLWVFTCFRMPSRLHS